MTKVTIGWICNQIMINIDQSNLKPTQASLKYPSSFILPDQFLKGTYLRSEVISEDASKLKENFREKVWHEKIYSKNLVQKFEDWRKTRENTAA